MVFSDVTNNSGLVQDADFMLGTDATRYPLKDKARNANNWLDKAVTLIFEADGRWQFDDSNYTDFNVATTDLVSGQKDYTLAVTHLIIERVEIKDSNGQWVKLKALDLSNLPDVALSSLESEDGMPIWVDKTGESLNLIPAPNYASVGGLKVYFKRGMQYFNADGTATTATPGFASIFHKYISLGMAFDYAEKKGMAIKDSLQKRILTMEQDIQNFYGKRDVDDKVKLRIRPVSFR